MTALRPPGMGFGVTTFGTAWPRPRGSQVPRLRGEVEVSIGVVEGESPYLFEDVSALTRDRDGRVYVADSGASDVRAFGPTGDYLYRVGGPGEGPGEFGRFRLCGLAFDPEGRLWVNQLKWLHIFSVSEAGAAYVDEVTVHDEERSTGASCGNPMFVGPTGLTVPRYRAVITEGVYDEHAHVAANGVIISRLPLVTELPEYGEWEWPRVPLRAPGLITNTGEELQTRVVEPPFAARNLVVSAPNGSFAQAFSPEYDIRVYHADGAPKARLRRDLAGPVVTAAEARRERERMERLRDVPEYRMPERKPVINRMWFDEEGRLWVLLWPAESNRSYEAHVYDDDGTLLHVAEWPRGIGLWYGGVRGDIAVGLREAEFDVQQVVILRFSTVSAPDAFEEV